MNPINQSERKAAMTKFTLFLSFTCLLLLISFLLYRFVPESASDPTPPITELTNQTVDPAQVAELKQKLSTLAESMNQVNIMFLVDATRGMEEHLPAVARAAQQIESKYQVEMMAACYRDAAEGAWLYMTNEMVGEAPTTWLNSLDTEAKFDRDEPEALFYGLKRALEADYLQPEETNILILVGDAGNHAQESLTDVPPSEIVSLLESKNCNFGAFQVRNPKTNPIYAEFSTQIIGDILEPVKSAFASYPFQEKDSVDSYGLSYRLNGKTKNLLYITDPSKALPPSELTMKINAFVDQVLSPIQQQFTQIQALAQGNYPASLSQATIDLLAQYQITQDQLNILKID